MVIMITITIAMIMATATVMVTTVIMKLVVTMIAAAITSQYLSTLIILVESHKKIPLFYVQFLFRGIYSKVIFLSNYKTIAIGLF